ncbi:MAG: metallophosphoesterase [Bacteroidia bacterium]|nr:metallophosphoesterase [Bacteroidia bacterium]
MIKVKINIVFGAALLVLVTTGVTCKRRVPKDDQPYTFFAAGHVYGTPGIENNGVHPPFQAMFPLLWQWEYLEFGVFLGDNVKSPSDSAYDMLAADIDSIGVPVYLCLGNHDAGNAVPFLKRYPKRYQSWTAHGDLFIILDPNLDKWNISGEQLEWLRQTLEEHKSAPNIFVFMHQVLWLEKDNVFKGIQPNSFQGKADTINFWSEIEPMFHSRLNQVYMFAGDVGAFPWWPAYHYYAYDNMHLIGTGMGGGKKDNFIIVEVRADRSVNFRLIALNGGNHDALGKLTDFVMPK